MSPGKAYDDTRRQTQRKEASERLADGQVTLKDLPDHSGDPFKYCMQPGREGSSLENERKTKPGFRDKFG